MEGTLSETYVGRLKMSGLDVWPQAAEKDLIRAATFPADQPFCSCGDVPRVIPGPDVYALIGAKHLTLRRGIGVVFAKRKAVDATDNHFGLGRVTKPVEDGTDETFVW
jgi:hypothetical protein